MGADNKWNERPIEREQQIMLKSLMRSVDIMLRVRNALPEVVVNILEGAKAELTLCMGDQLEDKS